MFFLPWRVDDRQAICYFSCVPNTCTRQLGKTIEETPTYLAKRSKNDLWIWQDLMHFFWVILMYKHARMMLYLKCWPFFSQDPFFSVPHSTKKSPMLTSGSSTPYASAILGRGWTEWKHPRVAQRSDAFVTLRDSILLDLGQGKHGSKIGKERIFNTFTNLVDVLTRWVYFQDPLINMIYHDWFLDGGTFGVWTLTALSLYIIYLYKSLTVSLSLSLSWVFRCWPLISVGGWHAPACHEILFRTRVFQWRRRWFLIKWRCFSVQSGCWAFFWLQKSSTVRLRLTFETFCSYLGTQGCIDITLVIFFKTPTALQSYTIIMRLE